MRRLSTTECTYLPTLTGELIFSAIADSVL